MRAVLHTQYIYIVLATPHLPAHTVMFPACRRPSSTAVSLAASLVHFSRSISSSKCTGVLVAQHMDWRHKLVALFLSTSPSLPRHVRACVIVYFVVRVCVSSVRRLEVQARPARTSTRPKDPIRYVSMMQNMERCHTHTPRIHWVAYTHTPNLCVSIGWVSIRWARL